MESRLHQPFLSTLTSTTTESSLRRPNYWTSNPSSLISSCNISSVLLGTGASIYHSIAPIINATEHELILVTCFWARSASLDVLRECLLHLSDKGLMAGSRIRVRICLSSVGLLQKLFHTQSLHGYVYPAEAWEGKLGLPKPGELQGLDLQVKSIFVKPFSVMHPKFIVVDRKRVLLPSCNVSWEDWFEGCIGLTGVVVGQFVEFWQRFWIHTKDDLRLEGVSIDGGDLPFDVSTGGNLPAQINVNSTDTPCVFLPSPHNIDPKFRLPWQGAALPPNTPLNVFLLAAFKTAHRSVYIQTPNLTSPPVLSALLDMMNRGVDLHIVTSERLMILEQLVTAGTTTSRCVKKLIKRCEKKQLKKRENVDGAAEEGRAFISGRLTVEYYEPSKEDSGGDRFGKEPVQSHLKLTIVDEELVVLGSGNLDRASWYTSQELGVAFYSKDLASGLHGTLGKILETRKKLVYDSGEAT
ncbi:hypothetical protein BDZ85DRAFT_98272 [Elsinoe ampelina]|uniref:PLD phosphodiesterase domain-containing protein n=1 Tax=Elsinoe ampelina TaxID=302913 RepID=A0A6A6GEJ0_9PEZI|nr:hypothetical protein BDZ85DRAFT_98272 [Elsinoe ampelina]